MKKIFKKPYKNPQKNHEVITFQKYFNQCQHNYERRWDTLMGWAVNYYFFFKRDWKSIKFIALPNFIEIAL
jgi:hypothetical protein